MYNRISFPVKHSWYNYIIFYILHYNLSVSSRTQMSNLMSVPFQTLYFHSHLCCSCSHWHWHPSLTLLLVARTVRHIFITTNGVDKAMSQYFYLYSLIRYQNEARHKYSSERVLYFYTSFFPIASLSVHAILPSLNKFFRPVTEHSSGCA